MEQHALRHCRCRRHAYFLTGKTALPKEIAFSQNSQRRFFSALRHHGQLHLSLLNEKESVRRIALRKDPALLFKRHHRPASSNGGEERVRVEQEFSLECHHALRTRCTSHIS